MKIDNILQQPINRVSNHVTIRSINNEDVRFRHFPEDKVQVSIKSADGDYKQVRQENLPKELRDTKNLSPELFLKFLQSVSIRTSRMTDNSHTLAVTHPLKGGMISNKTIDIKQTLENINESMRTLKNKTLEMKNQYPDKEVVLVIGRTGAGKSTLLNYLCGVKLEGKANNENTMQLHIMDGGEKPMTEIGYDTLSKTKEPQIFPYNGTIYVDCPGFEDNRDGGVQEIKNAFYIKHLFSAFDKVRVLFVAGEEQIFGTRQNELIKILGQLDTLFKHNEDLASSVALVVMQDTQNRNASHVENQLKAIKKGQEEKLRTFIDNLKDGPIALFPRAKSGQIFNDPNQQQQDNIKQQILDAIAGSKARKFNDDDVAFVLSAESKNIIQNIVGKALDDCDNAIANIKNSIKENHKTNNTEFLESYKEQQTLFNKLKDMNIVESVKALSNCYDLDKLDVVKIDDAIDVITFAENVTNQKYDKIIKQFKNAMLEEVGISLKKSIKALEAKIENDKIEAAKLKSQELEYDYKLKLAEIERSTETMKCVFGLVNTLIPVGGTLIQSYIKSNEKDSSVIMDKSDVNYNPVLMIEQKKEDQME